jgi:hypothetical protein
VSNFKYIGNMYCSIGVYIVITIDRSNSISQRHSYNPSINNSLGLAKYILRELKNNRFPEINFGINQFDNNKKEFVLY